MLSQTQRLAACPAAADFASGSIVPYSIDDAGRMYFMLGREAITADDWCEQLKWSAFGGSCKAMDMDVEETAAREFHEECMGLSILRTGPAVDEIRRGLTNGAVPATVNMVTQKNGADHIHAYFFLPCRDDVPLEHMEDEFQSRRQELLNVKAVADDFRAKREFYQRHIGGSRFHVMEVLEHADDDFGLRGIRGGRELVLPMPAALVPRAPTMARDVRAYNDFVASIQMTPDVCVHCHEVHYTDASGERAVFVHDVRVPSDVLELQELRFFPEEELGRMIMDQAYVARRRFRQRLINLVRFILPVFRQQRMRGIGRLKNK